MGELGCFFAISIDLGSRCNVNFKSGRQGREISGRARTPLFRQRDIVAGVPNRVREENPIYYLMLCRPFCQPPRKAVRRQALRIAKSGRG